jgi:hypothetical protein
MIKIILLKLLIAAISGWLILNLVLCKNSYVFHGGRVSAFLGVSSIFRSYILN